MNAATSAVATGVIIAAGRWSDNKSKTSVDVRLAIAITIYAIILSLLEDANADFAGKVGLLVLISACFVYLPDLVNATVNRK